MKHGKISNCNFRHALWFGGVKKYMPMRVYVHGEYTDKVNRKRLLVNKGDAPSRYHFGVKRKDIVWLEG